MIPREPQGLGEIWPHLPLDDENCWFFWVRLNPFRPVEDAASTYELMKASLERTPGQANRDDYMIDREMRRR